MSRSDAWRSDPDVSQLRAMIKMEIFQLFAEWRGCIDVGATSASSTVEDILFAGAASKEYMDERTLETRLKEIMVSIVGFPPTASNGGQVGIGDASTGIPGNYVKWLNGMRRVPYVVPNPRQSFNRISTSMQPSINTQLRLHSSFRGLKEPSKSYQLPNANGFENNLRGNSACQSDAVWFHNLETSHSATSMERNQMRSDYNQQFYGMYNGFNQDELGVLWRPQVFTGVKATTDPCEVQPFQSPQASTLYRPQHHSLDKVYLQLNEGDQFSKQASELRHQNKSVQGQQLSDTNHVLNQAELDILFRPQVFTEAKLTSCPSQAVQFSTLNLPKQHSLDEVHVQANKSGPCPEPPLQESSGGRASDYRWDTPHGAPSMEQDHASKFRHQIRSVYNQQRDDMDHGFNQAEFGIPSRSQVFTAVKAISNPCPVQTNWSPQVSTLNWPQDQSLDEVHLQELSYSSKSAQSEQFSDTNHVLAECDALFRPQVVSEADSSSGPSQVQHDLSPQFSTLNVPEQHIRDEVHLQANKLGQFPESPSQRCSSSRTSDNDPKKGIGDCGCVTDESRLQGRDEFFHAHMPSMSCFVTGQCMEPNCQRTKGIIRHLNQRTESKCGRIRRSSYREMEARYRDHSSTSCEVYRPRSDSQGVQTKQISTKVEANADEMSNFPQKRLKMNHPSPAGTTSGFFLPFKEQLHDSRLQMLREVEKEFSVVPAKETFTNNVIVLGNDDDMMDVPVIPLRNINEEEQDKHMIQCLSGTEDTAICGVDLHDREEDEEAQTEAEAVLLESKCQPNQEVNILTEGGISLHSKAVAFTQLFTVEQIKQHILSLRTETEECEVQAEKFNGPAELANENLCKLCGSANLAFKLQAMYCTLCSVRIRRNSVYYMGLSVSSSKKNSSEKRDYFCSHCYFETCSKNFRVDGILLDKCTLEKGKNDADYSEPWVQCERCEGWLHQICALFNDKMDQGSEEYICPICYINEIEKGSNKALSNSSGVGAKDLPKTMLSDHLEQRLANSLSKERKQRARALGKKIGEVPTAENLVVRVVSSVDKLLRVKQKFQNVFPDSTYPSQFPYKSKAIVLFQNIQGVDVLLMAILVQEYGSECESPNKRRVYLSYIDSIKYLVPDIRIAGGEALRTFVYHEILIGYLSHVKKRGFTSLCIWSCPPAKGDDYIFNCHPETQKTPKTVRLKQWYEAALQKAVKEGIVMGVTDLYNEFFLGKNDCQAKLSASRLPYFEGDYLPEAIENVIDSISENEEERKQLKKSKRPVNERALRAAARANHSAESATDFLLMQKLGERIRELHGCMMANLQHACSHCSEYLLAGSRWDCTQCQDFHLCANCHEVQRKVAQKNRHPQNERNKHFLQEVEINEVPEDTQDKDENIDTPLFDNCSSFLDFCRENFLQFDTLRRAKHSSMVVLHHLLV